ncbi:MAG: hydrolase [Verrucomicrobia bacterium]|nr:MAG: hydrolase [Verrucomicrobiota bacterium]
MFLRTLIATALILSIAGPVRAEESIGNTLKKIFSTPTPTPARKKKKTTTKRETPSPTASGKKASPSPTPHGKRKASASPVPEESTAVNPSGSPSKKKKSKASAKSTETPTPSPAVAETPTPEHSPSTSPEAVHKKNGAPTTRNLDYKYGSADPSAGGMDCSGFVYYVLKQNGVGDVPRDSSQQYVWLRRIGKFEPVLSRKDDSFEMENLKPGDLLFWTGTYSIERDPPITHAMIYLGREKKSGARVMVGASDGRIYQGQSRNGVSVFDFKVERRNTGESGKPGPTFIGYGHIPGLRD